MKVHCRELHRVVGAAVQAALLQGSPDAIAMLIELLATMATDHAYSATADPMKAITMLRDIIADRLLEIHTRQSARAGEIRLVHSSDPKIH